MSQDEGIAVFGGMGGGSHGAVCAGARIIATIDIDPWANSSHQANMTATKEVEFDLSKLVKRRDGAAEAKTLMVACGVDSPEVWQGTFIFTSPCQSFSKSGDQNLNDPRNRLVLAMLPLLKIAPLARMIFENVEQFLNEKFANLHSELFSGVRRLRGVQLDASYLRRYLLNSRDFGLAQSRQRLIAPIMRRGEEYPTPPTKTALELRTLNEIRNFRDPDGRYEDLTALEERLVRSLKPGEDYRNGRERDWFVRRYGEENGWNDRSNLLKISSWDRQAGTQLAAKGIGTSRVEALHPQKRRFTVGEKLALQGFPRNWIVLGDYEIASRLAGNAVPPPMMKAAYRQYIKSRVPDLLASSRNGR